MVTKSSSVNVRIEPELKKQAEHILDLVGISPTTAVEMLYKRVLIENGWPCALKIPNELTQKVFADTDRGINVNKRNSVADIFDEVEKDDVKSVRK